MRAPWPAAWTAIGIPCSPANRTAVTTSSGRTARTTTAGRWRTARFQGEQAL